MKKLELMTQNSAASCRDKPKLLREKTRPLAAEFFIRIFLVSSICLLATVAGNAFAQEAMTDEQAIIVSQPISIDPQDQDPYQKFNRAMFGFNRGLDKAVIRPVASVYHQIVPWPVAEGVGNFFDNVGEVPTVFNDVLQGNFYQATSDTWRFVINSTIGVLGLFDVASHIGLPENHEDFGLTLARWGYTSSNYLVLPFWGSTTVRDMTGLPIDYASTLYVYIPFWTGLGIYSVNVVNKRANYLNYDQVLDEAFDPYIFMRNVYLQQRSSQIAANNQRSAKDILQNGYPNAPLDASRPGINQSP